MNYKSPLPSIKKYESESPTGKDTNNKMKKSQEILNQSPHKNNQKEKLDYLKRILKLKIRQKAKDQKNKMQILNDNLRLYRDNLYRKI